MPVSMEEHLGCDSMRVEWFSIHQDGSFQEQMVNLSGGTITAWEQRTASITASEDYKLITVSIAYKKPGGTLWVDNP